jgi:hypothetical protein
VRYSVFRQGEGVAVGCSEEDVPKGGISVMAVLRARTCAPVGSGVLLALGPGSDPDCAAV